MIYKYSYKAITQLVFLPRQTQNRIADKMRFFASQKDPKVFAKRLSSEKIYRFRVGDYRILCDIKDNEIWIHIIERRDKAYD